MGHEVVCLITYARTLHKRQLYTDIRGNGTHELPILRFAKMEKEKEVIHDSFLEQTGRSHFRALFSLLKIKDK